MTIQWKSRIRVPVPLLHHSLVLIFLFFPWLEERGTTPQMLVFLTDLCGTFPSDLPSQPVLWASTDNPAVPFGQVISMEAA